MAVNGILFAIFIMIVIMVIIASIYFSPDIPVTNQEPEEADQMMECPEEGEVVSPEEIFAIAKIYDKYRSNIRAAGDMPPHISCNYKRVYRNYRTPCLTTLDADLFESLDDVKWDFIRQGEGLVHIVKNTAKTLHVRRMGCELDAAFKTIHEVIITL